MHLDVAINKKRAELRNAEQNDKAIYHLGLANLYYKKFVRQGNEEALHKSVDHSKKAKQYFKKQYSIILEGKARKRLALSYCYQGDFKAALKQNNKLEEITQNEKLKEFGVFLAHNQKIIHAFICVNQAPYQIDKKIQRRQLKEALKDLQQAGKMIETATYDEETKKKKRIKMMMRVGEVNRLLGNHADAIKYYQKVIEENTNTTIKQDDTEWQQVIRQRLHFDIATSLSLSFLPLLAIDSFLVSLSLSSLNGDKYVLKSVNKRIGDCYVDSYQYSHAIPYFESQLKLEKLEPKIKEMENRISKTKDLLRYSQKYEIEKQKNLDSMPPALQINYLKHLIDLAKVLKYHDDVLENYLKLEKLYNDDKKKLIKLYLEFESLVLKINGATPNKARLNTALEVCKRHHEIVSSDVEKAALFLVEGKIYDLLGNSPDIVQKLFVDAKRVFREEENEKGKLQLMDTYRCLRKFYLKTGHQKVADRYKELIQEIKSKITKKDQSLDTKLPPTKDKDKEKEKDKDKEKEKEKENVVVNFFTSPTKKTSEILEYGQTININERMTCQQIESNFDDFILDLSKTVLEQEDPEDKPQEPKPAEKNETKEKFQRLTRNRKDRARRRRGAPMDDTSNIMDKNGNILPVYMADENAWIDNDMDDVVEQDEEIEEYLEREKQRGTHSLKRTLNEIADDINEKVSPGKRPKNLNSPKKQKKKGKTDRKSIVVSSSESDADEREPKHLHETKQKKIKIKVQDKTIDYNITDGNLTVNGLIRNLQQSFRKDYLMDLKIKTLKIGKYELDGKECIVDLVEDGDVAVAVIEVEKIITILSLYHDSIRSLPEPTIETTIITQQQQQQQQGQKCLTTLDLSGLSIADSPGALFIPCLQSYFPLTSLDLSGNALAKISEDALATVLPYLPNLQVLDISSNSFSFKSQLPQSICKSQSLTHLSLAFNPIQSLASLHEVLVKCSKLESIDLQGLELNDKRISLLAKGFQSATSLTSLSLSFNDLAPSDPLIWATYDSLVGMERIRTLNLRNTGLDASHCSGLARLLCSLSLTHVDLACNKLGNDIQVLNAVLHSETSSKIQSIDLSYNEITSEGCTFISNLMRLATISVVLLRGNPIGEIGARTIAHGLNGTSLAKVDIAHCNLSCEGVIMILASLCGNKSIKYIDMGSNCRCDGQEKERKLGVLIANIQADYFVV